MSGRLKILLLAVVSLYISCGGALTAGIFQPKAGESLLYRVYFTGIAVGEQRVTVSSDTAPDGRPVLIIQNQLDSSRALSLLVDYHENRTLVWDVENLRPISEEAEIVQRKSTERETTVFDPSGTQVTLTRVGADGSTSQKTIPCVPGTQTGSSLLIYLRTFPWERGQLEIPFLGDKGTEWYNLEVEEGNEPRKTPVGTFDDPYHLINKDLKYDFWFARDTGHLPLEISSELRIGLAKMVLVEASGCE